MHELGRSFVRRSRLSAFLLLSLGAAAAASVPAAAGELVYKPVNPNFGGDPFNGAFMLQEAQIQNLYVDRSPKLPRSPAEDFQRRIQSAILGRVSSEISNQILGEDALDSGVFQIDSTTVAFQYVGDQVHITITDGLSGGTTEISIPAPTF